MAAWTGFDMTQQSLMEKSLGFHCLGTPIQEATLWRHQMPDRALIDTCMEGIRAEIQFPSCWNGELDSNNHTTHVAYPYQLRNGECPAGFDRRLPTLFYETIYATQNFINITGRFVFANGDDTGNGYHGDFINGWDEGVMKQILETPACTDRTASGLQEDCPILDIKDDSELVNCKMELPEVLQNEVIHMVDTLPGGCQVLEGVEWAKNCGNQVEPASSFASSARDSSHDLSTLNTPTSTCEASSGASNHDICLGNSPAITPTPSPTTTGHNEVYTYTSSQVVNGTVVFYIIVEEVVTTTVVVDEVSPTLPATTPASAAAKRRLHRHRHDIHQVAALHGSHGAHIAEKASSEDG
jgi:hypothetical protein